MTKPKERLHFLDAIRAFAIIMMLQGHFVHALLEDIYRDKSNFVYLTWEYLRGMTAPTFFTITGFVFSFLLLKHKNSGIDNPRVLKGIKRGVKVILWGYLLRLSLYAIFKGTVNPSFFYVDVLQCIGTSLLLLIGIYLVICHINKAYFRNTMLFIGVAIFLLQPTYGSCVLKFLPQTLANYFTSINGSIFTLFPWFGYVCFGSFMASIFLKYRSYIEFYKYAIFTLFTTGLILIFSSSAILMLFYNLTGIAVFKSVAYNNFLFIRLGNVFVLFSIFMALRNYFKSQVMIKVGGRTLSIYILHFFILYGSWFGLGLTRFFYHSLNPTEILIGALLFVVGICSIVLYYYEYERNLKEFLTQMFIEGGQRTKLLMSEVITALKTSVIVRKYRTIRDVKR